MALVSIPAGEHRMPGKDDPRSGTLTHPRFLDGKSPGRFADDRRRRDALADAVVSKDNPWFAAAFVNRVWGELMGQAFYQPVDDLGPQKEAVMGSVLARLAGSFKGSDYDVKALLRAVLNSETYQRQARPGETPSAHLYFAARYPTRLSADALWDSLTGVLGRMGGPPAPAGPRGGLYGFRGGLEGSFCEGEHQRATYQVHTGYVPAGGIKHPSFGALAAAELGPDDFDLPHFVTVGNRFATIGSSFLGMRYAPFVVGNANRMPANVEPPGGVGGARFGRRVGLLKDLEKDFAEAGGARLVEDHQGLYASAAQMVLSPRLRAFDLNEEKDSVRQRYGRTPFGQGCLLARRLVEAGVTFVEVESNGWDTHQDNFERVKALSGAVDPAFAALVGGGVKGGRVVGSTTDDGTSVRERPVTVADLLCTICHALKINPRKENISSEGRPLKIVDGGKPVAELF